MKANDPEHSYPRGIVATYRLLAIVVLFLALSLLGGTLYVLIMRASFGSNHTGQALSPQSSPQRTTPNSAQDNQALSPNSPADTTKAFTGIGRLRLSSASPNPSMIILSVIFRYTPTDNAFAEELAAHIADFRDIAANYISSLSTDELRGKTETELKTAILHRYNSILRLGQIDTLYFDEYMIID